MVLLDDFKVIKYPDGHKHLVSDLDLHGNNCLSVRIKSFDDLFLAAQAKRIHPELTHLNVLYLLAARCDRRFSPGQAIDLHIVLDFIASLNFERVTFVKPHNREAITEYYKATSWMFEINFQDPTPQLIKDAKLFPGFDMIICPDEGAANWIANLNQPTISFKKNRTEKGIEVIPGGPLTKKRIEENNKFLIVDDLCDGGGTFIEISKVVKSFNPNSTVILAVTHAIFSKGFDVFKGHIDHIYCTNSFDTFDNPIVTQLDIVNNK